MDLLQSQNVDKININILTIDTSPDDEGLHTLRILEPISRADVPVVPGAVFPLVRTEAETRLTFPLHGTPVWLGAWGHRNADVPVAAGSTVPAEFRSGKTLGPYETPPLPEGSPTTRPLNED